MANYTILHLIAGFLALQLYFVIFYRKELKMNPEMFREYDIRGIAGKDMTQDDVILIGKGVGTFLVQTDAQSSMWVEIAD